MKKRIALLLAFALMLSVTACTGHQAEDLMQDVSSKPAEDLPELWEGADAVADFGVRLFQNTMENGKNTLISPLSVLYALAMTANGADGETLAQMEQVLGMEIDDLNPYLLAYRNALPESEACSLRLANSIWFKDDSNLEVRQSFLQTNADYYGAGAYKAAFDEATKNDINNWVKENTNGMIPEILDEIPDEAIMYLVNALAFEAQWEEIYEKNQVWDGIFTTGDGTRRNVELMYSEEHAYLEDELSTGFLKYYKGGKYAFAALLPKEGVSIAQYVESLTGEGLLELLSDPERTTVTTAIPKFETEYSIGLGETLKEMGMPDAFDPLAADFSRLGSYDAEGQNLYINRVLHKTFLSVGERGTKAGAATVVEMDAGSAAIVEVKEVILDRPFVYLLIDCETNLPFFIGTMMDVEG